MELTARQKEILAKVTEHHISTGEPLGSKQLALLLNDTVSSATLRNEMSRLCEMGYLSQPHTSAGRVPTSEGYRFYVNCLMKEDDIDEPTKEMIDSTLKVAAADNEDLHKVASRLLSKITGLPAVSAVVCLPTSSVKMVRIIPLGSRVYMMALLLSDGRVSTKICRSERSINKELVDLFYKVIEKHISNRPICELTLAQIQNIVAFAGLDALELAVLFNQLWSLIKTANDSLLDLNGQTNVFSMLAEKEKANKLLSLIERKDAMLSLLSSVEEPLGVVFGGETSFSELNPSAVIVASYGADGSQSGRIAVIGPTRMSYDRIIPSTKYLAARLSSLMSENVEDIKEF